MPYSPTGNWTITPTCVLGKGNGNIDNGRQTREQLGGPLVGGGGKAQKSHNIRSLRAIGKEKKDYII